MRQSHIESTHRKTELSVWKVATSANFIREDLALLVFSWSSTGWPNKFGMELGDVILHQICYWAKVSIIKCSQKVELTVASIFYTRSLKRVKV